MGGELRRGRGQGNGGAHQRQVDKMAHPVLRRWQADGKGRAVAQADDIPTRERVVDGHDRVKRLVDAE